MQRRRHGADLTWHADHISCPWCCCRHESVPKGKVYLCPGCGRWLEWTPPGTLGSIIAMVMAPAPGSEDDRRRPPLLGEKALESPAPEPPVPEAVESVSLFDLLSSV